MCTCTTHTQHLWSVEYVFSLHSAICNLASNGLANLLFIFVHMSRVNMADPNLYSKFGDFQSFSLRNLHKQQRQNFNIHMIKRLLAQALIFQRINFSSCLWLDLYVWCWTLDSLPECSWSDFILFFIYLFLYTHPVTLTSLMIHDRSLASEDPKPTSRFSGPK